MPTDRTPLPTDIRTEAAGTWDPERPTGEMAAVDIGSVPDAASSRYAFVGMVGKGAMGEVKLAHDLQLQRPVAFKQMSAAIASRPQLALRFFQEAQVTAQLDHPNIVPVYGLERTPEGDLAYTMKLVQGITLEELMDEVRAAIEAGEPVPDDMDLESRLEHFVKICDALAYAHARGVIHRDLKPANVMVGAYHEIYVMDWGIAKILSVDDAGLTEFVDHLGSTTDLVVKQTQLGRAVGTPAYMSPEQANGQNDTLGPASDQFALGLMLYELITLDRAYKGTGVSVVMLAQNAAVRLPRKTADGTALPSDLAAILRKATRKKPEHRYASVDELADEVRRYLRGEETLARPDNVFRRLARVLQAYREAALVLMLLLVIVAGGVTVLGLAGVTAVRYASAVRQERLAQTITLVHDRASSANDYFLELQGLLEALSESAEVTLQDARPDADSPLYRSADYADPDRSPPDTVVTERYGEDAVNFRWPVFKLAPGVDADAVEPELRKLIRLRRTLRSNLLRSHSEDAVKMSDPQVIRLLGYEGVPIIWSYVATESGIHTSFPGHGPYPDAYDPRARPWYQLGSRNRGPVWGAPYIDVNGRGLILPCVQSLWSDEDELLGVAGIELTFDLVIEDLLRGTAIAGASEAWLTDAQGRVVVGSTDLHTEIGGGLHENKGLALEPLPLPAVIAAMKLRPTGYVEEDGQLTVYSRLDTLDWFLVVTGPEGAMLGGFVMAYTPFLRGERVYLRAIEQTDVERAHRWINDREIQRWLGAFRPYDLKAEQAWFDGLDRKPLPNTLHFAICLVDGDRHIGTTSMQQIDWLNRSASTGTLIGEKECWGQGYGKEAKALLLEYAFDTLNLNRMWSSTMPSNARSIAHLKANGYVAEGRRRQALFKDGAYQDELLWAVLRDDWKASRA